MFSLGPSSPHTSPPSTSLPILEHKPESLNEALVKTPKDMLLFSKKARQVDYKPCTLKEYRETKPSGYVELGKLQPDLYTEELVAKVKERSTPPNEPVGSDRSLPCCSKKVPVS